MTKPSTIDDVVTHKLETYLKDHEGVSPSRIYDMVINAVERPMLEVVMRYTDNNQARASEILGINRNTLRKKLQNHGMHQSTR